MTSEKAGGPKCIRLIELATQFWLTKGLIDENIFIWDKKIQIWIGKDSMKILEGLINLIEDLIIRKISFGVNLGVNWNKLKSGVLIFFRSFNWMNQGLNYKNIKVWWVIKDLIEEIKNQEPNWKRCLIGGVEIDQIEGQIEELKFWRSIKGPI
jgi:hypothetical protein